MATIVTLKQSDKTELETRRRIYDTLNIDHSNVVFAPAFCAKAREVYDNTDNDLPKAS